MANSGFIPGESFIRPIHPGNGYLQKYCGQRHPPEDPDRFPRKPEIQSYAAALAFSMASSSVSPLASQQARSGKKALYFLSSVGRKTAGYINFIGKIPFCIITRSVVICSFRSSIYQFQNEGKRVHDRMKDPCKNSSISGNVIIRKLSYIRENDRYIRLFILVGRKIRCYTVLYRVQDCCRRKRYTVI